MKTKYNPELTSKKTQQEASELLKICERHFQCNLLERNRKANNVNARMAFATLLRKKGYSFDKIGSFIEKDHATIIHYHRNIDMYLRTDDFFSYTYDRVSEEFDSYCTSNRLQNPKNFVERRSNNNFESKLPYYNEELIKHIQYINKEKKELSLIIEQLELKNKALEISESRVSKLIEIIRQRTKIGTEKLIEKKLHVWFNGVYEK